MKELPKLEIVPIKIESNRHKLDDILETWITPTSWEYQAIKDTILESPKCEVIIALLEEYQALHGCRLDNENKYRVCMLTRDLKKLNSPIIPTTNVDPLFDYKFSRPWTEWTVWDIEREFLEIHMLQGKSCSFAPSDRYTKEEVLAMLELLINCDVIYNFKTHDLFVNSIKGELNSYFRNYKKIRVQVL